MSMIQVPEFNGAVDLGCRAPPGVDLVCPCKQLGIWRIDANIICLWIKNTFMLWIKGTLPSKPLVLRGLCLGSSMDSAFIPANDRLERKFTTFLKSLFLKNSFFRKTGQLGYFGSTSTIKWLDGGNTLCSVLYPVFSAIFQRSLHCWYQNINSELIK